MTALTAARIAEAGTGTEAVIDVIGLRMRYHTFEAVRGIDLCIGRGEVFAFSARTVPEKQPPWKSWRAIVAELAARSGFSGKTRNVPAAIGVRGWAWCCRNPNPNGT
jgi:hypothetical protein